MSRRLAPTPLSAKTRARAAATRPKAPVPAPPAGNSRALKTGAQANGEFLPEFPAVKAEVQEAINAASWVQPTDLLMLDVFARELAVYRRASAALAKLGDVGLNKKVSAQKLQIRRARLLLQMAHTMGFTSEGRHRLGLSAAMTERMRHGAQPVHSVERAQQVAALLARSNALPPPPIEGNEAVEPEGDRDAAQSPDAATAAAPPIPPEEAS